MMCRSALLLQMKLLAELKVHKRNDDVSCKLHCEAFQTLLVSTSHPFLRACFGLKASLSTILIWKFGMDSRYSPHWEFCVQALTLRVSLALLGLWLSWAWRALPSLGRWQKQL